MRATSQMAVVRKTLTLDLNGMTVDYLTVGDVVPDEEGGILDSYNGNLTVVDNIQRGQLRQNQKPRICKRFTGDSGRPDWRLQRRQPYLQREQRHCDHQRRHGM